MKRTALRLLVIAVVGAAVLLLAERFGPGGVQRRGLKAANSFREQIAPTLSADSRFAAVQMSVTTHPGLRVYGEVPDERALTDLQRLVQAPPDAPFRTILHAKVRGPATAHTATEDDDDQSRGAARRMRATAPLPARE